MKLTRIAMIAVVLMANGLWADEVPEPITDAGEGVPIAVKAMLCLLPAVGALCLYRVPEKSLVFTSFCILSAYNTFAYGI